MAEVIKMPRLSDTMEEGVVSHWLKKVGDKVSEGDILAEIETDKATMEFESFFDGTLLHIALEEGVTAEVDSLLCIIGDEGEDISQYLTQPEDEPKQLDLVDQINEQEESENLDPVLITSEKKEIEESIEDIAPSNQNSDVDFSKVEYITMPRLSDTMEEGTISSWLKKVGDDVKEGDILAEIETDKATMEFESFHDGKLIHIGVNEGETVNVDELIAIISSVDISAEKALANFNSEPAVIKDKENSVTDTSSEKVGETEILKEDVTVSDKRVFASPLAKKIAADKNIDLSTISGSGDNGRIIKSDLDNIETSLTDKPPTDKVAETAAPPISSTVKPQANITKSESFDEIDNNSMRKAIAKRLSQSKFSAPHYYLSVEFNMDNAIAFREQYNSIPNTKISFNDIVIKACAIALREHPKVNSQWSEEKTRLNHHIHIGVAVGVEDGLVVPVIKFADSESLHSINSMVRDFAVRAKSKKLRPDEIEGSTFTISNLGMFGIKEFTSIINQPNSAILSVGSIIKKPVVIDDKITIGNTMKLTLACDHRTIDGVTGSLFLQTLKGYLENPVTILV
jgi:pyruvate dehydrogenase E2 component (dihydrolipoamide acetyltransferase)